MYFYLYLTKLIFHYLKPSCISNRTKNRDLINLNNIIEDTSMKVQRHAGKFKGYSQSQGKQIHEDYSSNNMNNLSAKLENLIKTNKTSSLSKSLKSSFLEDSKYKLSVYNLIDEASF